MAYAHTGIFEPSNSKINWWYRIVHMLKLTSRSETRLGSGWVNTTPRSQPKNQQGWYPVWVKVTGPLPYPDFMLKNWNETSNAIKALLSVPNQGPNTFQPTFYTHIYIICLWHCVLGFPSMKSMGPISTFYNSGHSGFRCLGTQFHPYGWDVNCPAILTKLTDYLLISKFEAYLTSHTNNF